jgi:hypothetical protein
MALVIAACGSSAGAPDVPDAARVVPPPVTCDDADGVCAECAVRAAITDPGSDLSREVCGIEPSCCTQTWDEHCAAMAQNTLGNGACADAVTFGGPGGITWARPDGDSFVGGTIALDDEVTSLAWAGANLAVTGPCGWRIYQANGTTLTPVASGGVCGFGGHRARWTDLDHDRDLDAVFAGDDGVMLARQDAGTFVDAGVVVPATDGPAIDVVAADVQGDNKLDLGVLRDDGSMKFYIQGGADLFTYFGPVPMVLNGATVAALCNVDSHTGVELVLAGPNGVEAVSIGPGFMQSTFGGYIGALGPTRDVACTPDGAAFLEDDGRVLTFARGEVHWDSTSLGTFDGAHLAIGSFTAFDFVIAAADGPFSIVEDLAHRKPGIDPDPAAITTSAAMAHLGGP